MNLLVLLALFFVMDCQISQVNGRVHIPFEKILLQEPAFEVDADSRQDESQLHNIASVPLVMRILFEEADRVSKQRALPQGGDFQALARSVRPSRIHQLGLQRVVLDFPKQETIDAAGSGAESWLVFQLRQPHMQDKNCSQVLTVYENTKSMRAVVSVPLRYRSSDNDPLLAINVTGSLRPSYVVVIKDSTSYTRDPRLYSFANYIDCSLARASEVLELNSWQASPVLLMLSPELAAEKLLGSRGKARQRRDVELSEETQASEEQLEDIQDEEFNEEGDGPLCQMMEWVVNVQRLGWDWLIYPERIPLNLCVGRCPILLDKQFNATSHAVVRDLYRLEFGQESKPENMAPCCVPVKYRRFTMLIEKSPGIISLETSSDLSAARCGCR